MLEGGGRATYVSLCLSTPRPPICQSSHCIPITVHCLETIKLMDNPGILRRRRAPVLMDRSGVALPYSFVSFFGKRREKSWCWGNQFAFVIQIKKPFFILTALQIPISIFVVLTLTLATGTLRRVKAKCICN